MGRFFIDKSETESNQDDAEDNENDTVGGKTIITDSVHYRQKVDCGYRNAQ